MSLPIGTAWRIARRDLNARFKGLRLLLVCIFLGTAALAAIGTLTNAIERELESSGQELLGGDFEVEVWQRTLRSEEFEALSDDELRGKTAEFKQRLENERPPAFRRHPDAQRPTDKRHQPRITQQ